MSKALVLAGHGSHISPNTAGVVWELVDELRRLGAADEVTAAFWKEFPSFHQVIDTLTADEIIVVPVFTARGYFTQTVIPAEMGLDGEWTRRDGRTIRYTGPLGEHPDLKEVALRRVRQTIDQYGLDGQETAAAVIGHGTRRSSESRATTQAQVEVIQASGLVAQAIAVYLDDTPAIPDIYELTAAPNVVAVPYFLASGSHTTIDVPRELGLDAGAVSGMVEGRNVYYTAPVGADCGTILKLAGLSPRGEFSAWSHFPTAGRDVLIAAIEAVEEFRFGQVVVRKIGNRQFVITRNGYGDEKYNGRSKPRPYTPTQIRDVVRGDFRPLATSNDLPGGWMMETDDPLRVHAVIETVYPGAVADWAQGQARGLSPLFNTLTQVTARQTGMFRELAALSRDEQAVLVESVCGGCVRHATWFDGKTSGLPCREQCNFWMSRAI
jgi:sirohydrochlorin cobaltochelatase